MAQRLLTLRVRPARIVVLINNTSTPDDFVLVVRFLSQIWGGRFNPILPVSANQSDALTEFRLASNRPDFVFGLNLDDSVWEPVVLKSCQPRKYVPLDRTIAEDMRKADRLNLIHSDRAIIANFEQRARPSAVVRPVKTVPVASSEWLPYYAALFGIHPDKLNEKYRDEQAVVETGNAIELIDTHRDFVEGWKKSWLDAGSFGLTPNYTLVSPVYPTIVLVEDIIADLCLFWNLRLGTDTSTPSWVIPVPMATAGSDAVLMSLRTWIESFLRYGSKPNFCLMTSVSVGRESIERTAAALRSVLSGSGIEYVDYKPPSNNLHRMVPFEHTTIWPAAIRQRQLTITPPSPQSFSTSGHHEAWFVDILKDNTTGRALGEMQLPESTVVPEILNAPCPPSFDRAVIDRVGGGPDGIDFYCSSSNDVVRFQIPTSIEVLEEILQHHGYHIIPDEKRSSYLPVMRRFGGMHSTAIAMSGQAGQVLEILRSGQLRSTTPQVGVDDSHHQSILIAQGHALTPKQIKSIGRLGNGKLGDAHFMDRVEQLLNPVSDRIKRIGRARFRRYVRRQVPDEMTLQSLLEHWAERSVLSRKWQLGPCSRCGRLSFVGRIDLRKSPRCVHCGNRMRMKEQPPTAYSLKPSVRHALNQGLATVAMTGRFLRNLTNNGFFWLPGVKYRRNEIQGDIDLLACCDGLLVFGECKTLASTPNDANAWTSTTEQFLRLASVAMDCRGALVVLAALVDAFPEEVQLRIEAELSGKIPFLLLNKTDLDKGRKPAQPEKEWPSMTLQSLLQHPFPEDRIERTGGPRKIETPLSRFAKLAPKKPKADEAGTSEER